MKSHEIILENGVFAEIEHPNERLSIQSNEAKCILSPTFSLIPSEEIEFSKNVTVQILSKEESPITAVGGIAIYKMGAFTLYPEIPNASCSLDFQPSTAKNFPPIHLEAQEIQFQSAKKELICKQAKGFMTIEDKPSFLVADQIHFDTEKKTLFLSSASSKKVLFWQEGFSLSAPKIQIEKNPITKQETIQGIGDTRFQFNQEEQSIINNIISKYL